MGGKLPTKVGSPLTDRQAIEAFITSPELVELETRFARFNIFEALNVARRELNHSNFLAFLLDPVASHGMHDLFLRRFLQDASRYAEETPVISAIEIELLDLSQVEVLREYGNIDIFLRDSSHKLAVIIENKVGSKQHSDQLERYRTFISSKHPDYRIVGIYLTPEGEESGNKHYASFSYENVRNLVLEVLSRETVLIGNAVRSALEQYTDLLGRRFMADRELEALCAKLYKRHKQAIDILVANIPDERGTLAEKLEEFINSENFISDDSNNVYVRFMPPDLDLPFFLGGSGWTSSTRIVLFEFRLQRNAILVTLQMGPGPADKRERIHKFALTNKPPFSPEKNLSPKYQRLFTKSLLDSKELQLEEDAKLDLLETRWKEFLEIDLPQIKKAIIGAPWAKEH